MNLSMDIINSGIVGSHDSPIALFAGGIGWQEILLVGMFGLILFGKRLPEVGRSLGKSIVEFKKGLKGVEDDIDDAVEGRSNQADMLPPPQKNASSGTGSDSVGEKVSQTNNSHS